MPTRSGVRVTATRCMSSSDTASDAWIQEQCPSLFHHLQKALRPSTTFSIAALPCSYQMSDPFSLLLNPSRPTSLPSSSALGSSFHPPRRNDLPRSLCLNMVSIARCCSAESGERRQNQLAIRYICQEAHGGHYGHGTYRRNSDSTDLEAVFVDCQTADHTPTRPRLSSLIRRLLEQVGGPLLTRRGFGGLVPRWRRSRSEDGVDCIRGRRRRRCVRLGFGGFLGVDDVFRDDVDPFVSPSTNFGFHRVLRSDGDLLEEDIVRSAHGHICPWGKDGGVSLKSEVHSSSISILGITPALSV